MSVEQKSKRDRLTEIVASLGPDANPAEIRAEAYRLGFGVVNGHMLMSVRDTLWPGRVRKKGGYYREQRSSEYRESLAAQVEPCTQCGSIRVWAKKHTKLKKRPGMATRKYLCADCNHYWSVTVPFEALPPKRASHIRWATMTEKKCTYCGRVLPIEAFSLQSGSDIIRRPGCKECSAENRARYIGRDIEKRYGITLDHYNVMLEQQGGLCAICRTSDPFGRLDNNVRKRKRRTFSVDHCHATGKVRGLLCARCNLAIGNFSDDTSVMRAAIEYIESRREKVACDGTQEVERSAESGCQAQNGCIAGWADSQGCRGGVLLHGGLHPTVGTSPPSFCVPCKT